MEWQSAAVNVSRKITGRILAARKPFVRVWRRTVRATERLGHRRQEWQAAADIGRIGRGAVIVGPWLGEVGYEALYWIPFLNWFKDRYRLSADQLLVVTRGGAGAWYGEVTTNCAEIFDYLEPREFAADNNERRARLEGGGQKQMSLSALDNKILDRIRNDRGWRAAHVCHPSLMFRLFRQFWLGNRSLDFVLNHTRYLPIRFAGSDPGPLPCEFVAVKLYTGRALANTPSIRSGVEELVRQIAQRLPVIVLDTGMGLDDHEDYTFDNIPGVTSFRRMMTPQNNLAVQAEVIRRASLFVGTCGSLAWLAPMLGVPTMAVYADDRLLTPHLYFARHAYRLMRAAPFMTIDLRTVQFLDSVAPLPPENRSGATASLLLESHQGFGANPSGNTARS